MAAPPWTNAISNKTICTFYFAVFFITTLLIVYIVFPLLRSVITNPFINLPIFLGMVLVGAYGISVVLFPYILCVRAFDKA